MENRFALAPVTVIVGHYGVGKTNFALNVALDAAASGAEVVLADLDVVNPYFRSSDYTTLLESRGVRVVAPVLAGTSLDTPSVSGQVATAIEWAQEAACAPVGAAPASPAAPANAGLAGPTGPTGAGTGAAAGEDARPAAPADDARVEAPADGGSLAFSFPRRLLVIDAGGDDVGATALGRFARLVEQAPYTMLYLVNRYRNLTQHPAEAAAILGQVQEKAHLRATGVVNNSHLQGATDAATVLDALPFGERTAGLLGLPLVCATAPKMLACRKNDGVFALAAGGNVYPVTVFVQSPWEQSEEA